MNENMNRQETELNEAALEGVSGGASYEYVKAATQVCRFCDFLGYCSRKQPGLAEYLQQNGIRKVFDPSACPFYWEAHDKMYP